MEVSVKYCIICTVLSSAQKLSNGEPCPPLPGYGPENGYYIRIKPDLLQVKCNKGYDFYSLSYQSEIIPCIRGQWDSRLDFGCIEIENVCSVPEDIENGSTDDVNNRTIGSYVRYRCNGGYEIDGNSIRKCLENRYWSGITPRCTKKIGTIERIVEMLKTQNQAREIFESDSSATLEVSPSWSEGLALGPAVYEVGLEMIFIVDRSDSIEQVDLNFGLGFVKFLIQTFGASNHKQDKTRVALITFGSKPEMIFNLNNDKVSNPEKASELIDNIKAYGGGTALQQALTMVVTDCLSLLRNKAKRAIVLLTDGEPTGGDVEPEDVADTLKKDFDFEIFTVGIGRYISTGRLEKIASSPSSYHTFHLNKFGDFEEILFLVQNNPTTTEAPPLPGPEVCGYMKKKKDENQVPFPWTVAILVHTRTHGVKFCAGVLVCQQWILSSASCVVETNGDTVEATKIRITLGENNIGRADEKEISYYVEKVELSAKHVANQKAELRMALLKLNEKVPMKEIYRPVCLAFNESRVEKPLHLDFQLEPLLEGWGSFPSNNTNLASLASISAAYVTVKVQRTKLQFLEEGICSKYLHSLLNATKLEEKLMCIGTNFNDDRSVGDNCSGNFGSPLIVKNKKSGLFYLIGIQASKFGCTNERSVFILLSHYKLWIHRTTKSCWHKHEY